MWNRDTMKADQDAGVFWFLVRIVERVMSERIAHPLTYQPGAKLLPLHSVKSVATNGAVPPNNAEAMLYESERPV